MGWRKGAEDAGPGASKGKRMFRRMTKEKSRQKRMTGEVEERPIGADSHAKPTDLRCRTWYSNGKHIIVKERSFDFCWHCHVKASQTHCYELSGQYPE